MDALFEPCDVGGLHLRTRIVMSPMTRGRSPGGVPTPDVSNYYRRRAEADVGLIITEGAWIDHTGAGDDDAVPKLYGDRAIEGWRGVVEAVHSVGGKIVPQLWHVGLQLRPGAVETPSMVGPSGVVTTTGKVIGSRRAAMSQKEIDAVVLAYGEGAATAKAAGFDGVALHGGHGYMIDQFLWDVTNTRSDEYGASIRARAKFAADVVRECRRRVGENFPIILRLSQWKLQDYDARLVRTSSELEALLAPLVEAGVDIFDVSQRRFWEPAFEGSELSFAGWIKKISERPVIAVGSVGLSGELMQTLAGETVAVGSFEELQSRFEGKEFDLVGVGRALLADPLWARKIKTGAVHQISSYHPKAKSKFY